MEKEKDIDVLFVEDSPDDSELTGLAITQASDGIRFKHFTDGSEALQFILGRERYAGNKIQKELKLVLLDLRLPTMDGLDVLRRIREESDTRMLPVVILSSSTDASDIKAAYRLGVNSYVIKPERFEGYVKKVASLASYWNSVNEKPY